MWADDIIAGPMGFKYAVLFPRARDALFHFSALQEVLLPTNICPEAAQAVYPTKRTLVPVEADTGMALMLSVQLYGYRERASGFETLDLDPLMTGWFDRPCAKSAIISLGRKKIMSLNGGGAFLTQDDALAKEMRRHEYFPGGPEYIKTVMTHLNSLPYTIEKRFKRIATWDRYLGDSCVRIPMDQIMPWRVMRRIPNTKRDTELGASTRNIVVKVLRDEGIAVGVNYPPLSGVTAPGAIQWGKEVINFLIDDADQTVAHAYTASETIKRVVNG